MHEKTENVKKYNELEVVNVGLVKEPSIISETSIENSQDADTPIKNFILQFDREAFCVLNLSNNGKPISMNVTSIGILNSALVVQERMRLQHRD